MLKIAFIGAGSTIFAKNVLGDCMMTPALAEAHIALHDIDLQRLKESETMLQNLNRNNGNKATIIAYADRREALKGATYVVNAITAGAFEPYIRGDHEIPRKYGLKQTYADTLGIGGLFRGLRTAGPMLEFARDMEELCPDAWFLNYTNPMAILTGALLRGSGIKAVGLCHSVQVCAKELLEGLGMSADNVRWRIAGINHQAWLLDITRNGEDLYPEIKRRAAARPGPHDDMVRYEIMNAFGCYVTESSMHGAEYVPYFIKNAYPELLERYNVPTENYKGWGNSREEYWEKVMSELVNNAEIAHTRTHEYASYIMEAMETNVPFKIAGNVLNTGGLISNLPEEACVEVPCLVDGSGVTPTRFGALPPQLAALNRTNINMQLLAVEAILTGKREHVYHAALLDPHTSAELPIDRIKALVDEMIEANGSMLPAFK
ncbi:alpha-glucosidase/alpha-galactosidase [Cohnella zeiphila]|uniref:Alpha-glucosidase/alpha-galactosidase n=1 Tax=Cohnella zeiphila TaxID=2761120 RepID=A0A7X0SHT8_9BACL|nr:alpha-glucosidase/alpha-galactosidase [Cohnella zeiphila]MBB6730219.1 alpha-glucosidase/alpha-galactosidase [Cohnella zeiphila]